MKAWIGTVALIGLLGSSGAMAADPRFDGNELLEECQQYIKAIDGEKSFDGLKAGICGGFVAGVRNTVSFFNENLKKDERHCIPANVTNGQLVRVVVKSLQDKPQMLHMERTGLVWIAIRNAYPCK